MERLSGRGDRPMVGQRAEHTQATNVDHAVQLTDRFKESAMD
jgi:hypothetical protein